MPAHPEVVRQKLLDISEVIGHLRSWFPVTLEALEGDMKLRWAVERGLQIAAESPFDAGNHILAAEFHESPDEYRDMPPRLVARDVISSDTARRLDNLAGFRNILVHDYADIDRRRVHTGLERLDDFEAFVADVEGWLSRSGR